MTTPNQMLHIAPVTTAQAIIILSGGIACTKTGYSPTTFTHRDPFGMLGGGIRVIAAAELYKHFPAIPYVFTTGVTAKTIADFGPNVPSEATIYRDAFTTMIGSSTNPITFLEDQSVNTIGNIQHCLAICQERHWQRVVLITSAYHVPRAEALVSLVKQQLNIQTTVTCLAAEDIVRELAPGVYDAEITVAYQSADAKERLTNEAAGVAAIQSGSYTPGEFQLRTRT